MSMKCPKCEWDRFRIIQTVNHHEEYNFGGMRAKRPTGVAHTEYACSKCQHRFTVVFTYHNVGSIIDTKV